MKKLFWALVLSAAGLFFAAPSLLGFSLLHLSEAVGIATGMGAKLACSARYISGFEKQLIRTDLASYSPVNNLLSLDYDEQQQSVTAELFGLSATKAQFYPSLGCSLVMDGAEALTELKLPRYTARQAPWPQGEQVQPQSHYQTLTESILAEDNQQGLQSRAILVVKDGQLVAEAYSQGTTKDTPLLGWSMAKSVTAMLVGRMQYLGKASLEQDGLFSQWQQDERKRVQLQHLLTMSSGLDFDETYAPGSDATRMLFLAASASDVALASPLAHKPGSLFYYSSGTTNMLTRWLSDTLGGPQPMLDFLHQELLQPLNMSHSLFETDSSGVLVGSSYLYASGRDWARLGALMAGGGELNGVRLLSEEWVKQAATPNTSDNDRRYGYQFWLNAGRETLRWPQLPKDTYAMLGNRKQAVVIVPSENMVVVRLGWTQGDYPLGENVARLLHQSS